ncbi:MAG: acetylglutamate kinase [Chloroflexota bacterium]
MTSQEPPILLIKVGGNTGLLEGALGDLPPLLAAGGLGTVIVHGGGPAISRLMDKLALPVSFRDGLRVTDSAALAVATMVLRGQVNTTLVGELVRQRVRAVGLSGVDAGMVRAIPHPHTELGFVGQAGEVRPELPRLLIAEGMVPCVAPLALDDAGQLRNLNADTMAGALAAALGARWTVFLTDVPGILRGEGSLAERLSPPEVEAMILDGQISGGMIPKARACLDALGNGARAVYIADGRRRGGLAGLLAGDRSRATMIANAGVER